MVEAAKHLKRMLVHFPNDSWPEIVNIIEQLQVPFILFGAV